MQLSGCSSGSSSGSSGGDSSALSLTGSLSLTSTSQSFAKKVHSNSITQLGRIGDDYVSMQSIDLTAYTVTCSTTTSPVLYGTSSVSADGSFKVSIAGAENKPMSCFLVDGAGVRQADFIISDSSKKDLNGANQISGTATYKKSADLGAVNFDPNAGEVTVPKASISSSVNDEAPSDASVFDPTGNWTIGSLDFTAPQGVKEPCAENNNSCKGPPGGMTLYLKLWKGIQTADSANVYGLQLWEGESKFTSCGSKIGLTSTVKSSIGVDFSQNGSSDDVFSFASSVSNFNDQISNSTGNVTLTNNWKMNTARTQWDMNPNCGPRDLTIGGVTYTNSWVCGPDSSSRYQAQLGGGCQDLEGRPVQLQDWSGISCGSMTTASNGIRTVSCTGSATINSVTKSVTCTNKWAVTDSSYVVQTSSGVNFNWTDLNASQIASNTLCSSISTGTESQKIAQAQCYAGYYDRSGMREANACLPRVDMDWSATTAANFIKVDNIRPNGLVFFEQYKPFSDGSGGTMVTRQEHYDGVQVNGNSWVNCHVIEIGGLTIKKISDTKLLATYQQSTVTTSTSKPACLAEFNGARETFMFYLTK